MNLCQCGEPTSGPRAKFCKQCGAKAKFATIRKCACGADAYGPRAKYCAPCKATVNDAQRKLSQERNRETHQASSRAYKERNRELIREKSREYSRKRREDPGSRQKELQSSAAYRERNREKLRERSRESYAQNAEKRRVYASEYRKRNPEKVKAALAAWHQRKSADPEFRAANVQRVAEWAKANPDKVLRWKTENADYIRERAREQYWRDPAARYKKQCEWRAANPERVRELVRRNGQRRRARLLDSCSPGVTSAQWRSICEAHGFCCAYCGAEDKLTIDHVVPISRGGLDAPDNVVPACKSCNSSKGAKTLDEWLRMKTAA